MCRNSVYHEAPLWPWKSSHILRCIFCARPRTSDSDAPLTSANAKDSLFISITKLSFSCRRFLCSFVLQPTSTPYAPDDSGCASARRMKWPNSPAVR